MFSTKFWLCWTPHRLVRAPTPRTRKFTATVPHSIQEYRNLIPGDNLVMEYYPILGKVEILLVAKCHRNRNKLLQESTLVFCINFFNLPYSEKRGHLNYYDGLLKPDKREMSFAETAPRFPNSLLILQFSCYRVTWLRWKSTPSDWTWNWFSNSLRTWARQISAAHPVGTGHPNMARYWTFIFSK